MFEIASIFSVPPEAAAVISGAPGYESLTGYVLLYGAPGGTVVVAQLEGLPSGGFFALHLHQGESCRTIQEAFDGAGPHWGLPGQLHPNHLGDLPVLLATESGFAWSAVFTDAFCQVKPGGVPSLSIICRMTTVHNRQETPERELAAA